MQIRKERCISVEIVGTSHSINLKANSLRIISAFVVMTDISGYTRFMRMHATSLLHAEAIITELIEAVLDKADYPLTVAKLEGDAVFFYAEVPPGEETAAAKDITQQINRMFTAFYATENALIGCRHGCVCDACTNIGQLKLKAILHSGTVTLKQIHEFNEVTGPDVLLVHRLLKNSIPNTEYVLMTETFHTLAGDFAEMLPERRTEQVDEFGPIKVLAYYPGIEIRSEDMPKIKGSYLAARLNQHSFARMFGRKKRAEFSHLPMPKMNLGLYLIEGINSGLNVLRQQFERR